jgi:hypothetical protein
MRLSIDLDRQPRIAAEEVEDVRSGWMLSAEFEAFRALAQPLSEDHFRQAHFPAQLACVERCA